MSLLHCPTVCFTSILQFRKIRSVAYNNDSMTRLISAQLTQGLRSGLRPAMIADMYNMSDITYVSRF